MTDFPWEILKAETLRSLSHELGIKRNLKKEEAIVFLRAVQKRGLGPALADEIAKDFTSPNQKFYEAQPEINGRATPSSSPTTSPVTKSKTKAKAKSSPRRISTRKRPAPESEPGPEALFLPTDNEEQDQDQDAQGDTDHGEYEEVLESGSMAGVRHSRRKGVKRVRLSEPGYVSAPARSTRSRKDASPSGPSISTSGAEKRMTRASANANASVNVNGSERRTTRKSRRRVEEESDRDAEGESEQSEEEKGGEEEGRRQTRQFTGPRALAAALTQANTESRTPRLRGRQPNAATSTTSSSRPRGTASATATKAKTQSQSAVLPRTRSSAPSSPMGQRPKRTIKPTLKAALLSPAKTSVSTPNRPARAQLLAQQRQRRAQAQTRIKAMKRRPADRNGSAERSETPKEIFDGVLLKKRRINGGSGGGGYLVPGHGEGGLDVHLDEFVANGLEREHVYVNVNGDEMDRDPVLDRDDMSSLGGSNKENDFSFRNDVSESTEGPEDRLPIGEEDAEGELEPGADAFNEVENQLLPQVAEMERPDQNDAYCSPLQEVPQPRAEFEHQSELRSEPQLEPQLGSEAVAEPELVAPPVV